MNVYSYSNTKLFQEKDLVILTVKNINLKIVSFYQKAILQ
ncbi:hypothetical protein pb186bvf_015421 [Paramecium bursaria]